LAVLIDGAPGERIPVTDRGLSYGDGLFETLALADAGPCLWGRHLERLDAGCRRLGIAAPDHGMLRREAAQAIAGRNDGVLKIILTRGNGGRGYRPDPAARPRRILLCFPGPEYPASWAVEGVQVRFCATQLGRNPRLAGIKHLNRLEQVLARAEWANPAIAEGLMLDSEGLVIEGTMSNLFVERDGRLLTPRLDRTGVAGVVRTLVLEQARAQGIVCEERDLKPHELLAADALFLTNSLIGIWPVRRLEERRYSLGALTLTLREAVRASALGTPEWRAPQTAAGGL
jgi:4-amino-4-deoxychorismate lyase